MRVLISGYYGFSNVGDEAVLEAVLLGLRQRNPGIEITVLSATPELTAELNKVKSIYRYDWLRMLSKMRKADVLVSGGGTLFQDATSARSFWYYIGMVFLAKLLRKKTVIFAQGFGPLERKINQWIARFVLNGVDLITVRDGDSLAKLKEIGVTKPPVHLTADPTVILEMPQAAEGQRVMSLEGIPTGKPLLGVSVRSIPHRADLEGKLFPLLAEVLDHLVKKFNYQPVFILFQCPEDMAQASKVIGSMKESSSVIFRICRPREMLALISQFDLLIGMRLHSLIFAAMGGVPMSALSYDPKVEAFMKSVEQPCLKIEQEFDFKKLKQDLERIVSNKEAIRNDLANKRKVLYNKAAMNFDLFFGT